MSFNQRDDGHDPMIPSGAHMVEPGEEHIFWADGPRQERLSRPAYMMRMASLTAERSTCLRAEVGIIAVRDRRIVASGYVGAPAGMPHCLEVGCEIESGGCIRSIHAEANLISWAAREGIPLHDTVFWCTHAPCLACAKLMSNLSIKGLVYYHSYRDPRGLELLMNQDIPVHTFARVNNA